MPNKLAYLTTDDTFDFSNSNETVDANMDSTVQLSRPLLIVAEDVEGESGGIADIEYFFGNPFDIPLADTPTDTTFGDDFIA
jgi:hypothetical protein